MRWQDAHPNLDESRLTHELGAFRAKFPQYRVVQKANGQLEVQVWLQSKSRKFYLIAIRPKPNYPHSEPELYPINPPISGAPHMYQSGALCTHYKNWNPARSTLLTMPMLAQNWLNALEEYQRTKTWPQAV